MPASMYRSKFRSKSAYWTAPVSSNGVTSGGIMPFRSNIDAEYSAPPILSSGMQRYPMFDPPEYVQWTPSPRITEEYLQTLERDPERAAIIQSLTMDQLIAMYAGMVDRKSTRLNSSHLGISYAVFCLK